MVNNINKILDEGIIKLIMSKEYKMKPSYIYDFEKIIRAKQWELNDLEQRAQMMVEKTLHGSKFRNGYTSRMYDEICERKNKLSEDVFIQKWMFELEINNGSIPKCYWNSKSITDFLGVVPFTPSVMINISPNWNVAKDKLSNTTKAKRLESCINEYMKIDNRYDYYSYAIENGSDGEHIHAHIVAHVNPKLRKSVIGGKKSHIGKGDRLPGALNTCGGKRGMKGVFSGKGISTTILNCEDLVKDKLNYLIEDLKPEGHKNKSNLTGKVDIVLFTVK